MVQLDRAFQKMTDKIKFLGTAGARMVVAKQLRSSAGTWITLDEKNLLLDPGPGTLVRCAKSRPALDPTQLDAIILSHQHIDHANDVNIMIEAMTNGGFSKKGALFAPLSALENDPIVLRYAREYVNQIHILKEGSSHTLGSIEKSSKYVISFIVDSRFFPDLITKYKKSDLIVINVVRYDGKGGKKLDVDHLNLMDVKRIITGIKPKQAILTHFGMTMVRSKPWEVASQIEQEIGIKTIAASDGMEFDLE